MDLVRSVTARSLPTMPVVDATVVVDWLAPDADPQGPARRFLDGLAESSETLAAPRLLGEEVANALLTGIRRGRWDGVQADDAVALLRALPVETIDDARDFERAWDLSRRFDQHPVYAMVYVALAERLGQELVTADAALARRVKRLTFVTVLDS